MVGHVGSSREEQKDTGAMKGDALPPLPPLLPALKQTNKQKKPNILYDITLGQEEAW